MRRLLLVSALLLALPAMAADRITGRDFATRSEVIAPHAMAATSHPLVTQIALDVMKNGGSAVDAAIAADAALGLMEPTGSGIGGDLFAIVWDPKTKKLYGYNGSGRSPKSLTLEYFQKQGLTDIPPLGPLPVSVPGAVDGWFALHDRFGKAPMTRRAGAGHPLRARRPSAGRDHRLLLGPFGAAAVAVSRLQGTVHHRRPRAAHRRDVEEPEPRRHPAEDRRRRPRCVLQGRHRRTHRRLLQGQRRLPQLRGPGRAPRRMGRAGQHQLSRLRRMGTAAERPGHRRAADAQRAGRLRLLEDPVRQCRARAPVRRSQETRLRRSRALVCRSRIPAGAGGQAHLQGVCGPAPQADFRRQAAARSAAGHAGRTRRRRHHLPDHRRCQRHDGVADPVQLPRHGQRHGAAGTGLHPAGPRRDVRAEARRPSQLLRTRQASVPDHHSRRSSPRTASLSSASA